MYERLYNPPPVTAFFLMNEGPSHQFSANEQQAGSIIFECRVQIPGNRYPGVKFGLET